MAPSTSRTPARAASSCQGKGENKFCLGLTSSVVRVANGNKSTVVKGLLSAAGAGGVFATGVHGVSVAPDGRVFGVKTSGPPKDIRGAPAWVRKQAGRLFDLTGGTSRRWRTSR